MPRHTTPRYHLFSAQCRGCGRNTIEQGRWCLDCQFKTFDTSWQADESSPAYKKILCFTHITTNRHDTQDLMTARADTTDLCERCL